MSENVMDQVIAQLKDFAAGFYSEHGELRNVRIVGHTPKADHYIYEIVVDFAGGSERLAAKVYRGSKCGPLGPRGLARQEFANLQLAYSICQKKQLSGVPRPIGDFTEAGTVVIEKFSGLPLQSIIMKAALLPGYAHRGTLEAAAGKAGKWLHSFHDATAHLPLPFDPGNLLPKLVPGCTFSAHYVLEFPVPAV